MEIRVIDYLTYNSVVTLTLFFLSLVALFINYSTHDKANRYIFSTERASLLKPLTYLRFFTHTIGHSDWSHFRNNFLIILIIGPLVEEKYGSIDYLIMILMTSFVIALVNFIRGKSRIKGASGIVYMLIALSAFVNMSESKIPITLILISLFYIVDEIIDLKKEDNISHGSHLLGAICGIVFGFVCVNQSLLDFLTSIVNDFVSAFAIK